GQAQDAHGQDQQGDHPVQGLADAAPAGRGVLGSHGGVSSTGGGDGTWESSRGTGVPVASTGGVSAGSAAFLSRTASASIRRSTASPIIDGQPDTPNALRLSVAVAEKPAVRRNGGSG